MVAVAVSDSLSDQPLPHPLLCDVPLPACTPSPPRLLRAHASTSTQTDTGGGEGKKSRKAYTHAHTQSARTRQDSTVNTSRKMRSEGNQDKRGKENEQANGTPQDRERTPKTHTQTRETGARGWGGGRSEGERRAERFKHAVKEDAGGPDPCAHVSAVTCTYAAWACTRVCGVGWPCGKEGRSWSAKESDVTAHACDCAGSNR